jgi:hypothetical protein
LPLPVSPTNTASQGSTEAGPCQPHNKANGDSNGSNGTRHPRPPRQAHRAGHPPEGAQPRLRRDLHGQRQAGGADLRAAGARPQEDQPRLVAGVFVPDGHLGHLQGRDGLGCAHAQPECVVEPDHLRPLQRGLEEGGDLRAHPPQPDLGLGDPHLQLRSSGGLNHAWG